MTALLLSAQQPKPVAGGTASPPVKTTKWAKSRARIRKVAKVAGHGAMIGLECVGAGAVLALEVLASSQR